MIASRGRVEVAPAPPLTQWPTPSAALRHDRSWPRRQPLSPEPPLLSPAQTELSWRIQFAARPLPPLGAVDVVQAGLRVGLRAVEGVREQGLHTGPVLCCLVHSLVHIPVEADTAYRWHAPQTLCRPGAWECSTDKQRSRYSSCAGVWLLPADKNHGSTDSDALFHRLSMTRSAGARNWGVRHGS